MITTNMNSVKTMGEISNDDRGNLGHAAYGRGISRPAADEVMDGISGKQYSLHGQGGQRGLPYSHANCRKPLASRAYKPCEDRWKNYVHPSGILYGILLVTKKAELFSRVAVATQQTKFPEAYSLLNQLRDLTDLTDKDIDETKRIRDNLLQDILSVRFRTKFCSDENERVVFWLINGLIEQGAKVVSSQVTTAIEKSIEKVALFLLRHYVSATEKNECLFKGWMNDALYKGYVNVAKMLISQGAAVSDEAMSTAYKNCGVETCFEIIGKYFSVNLDVDEDNALRASLLRAILNDKTYGSNMHINQQLITQGVNVNKEHLEMACRRRFVDESVFKILIDNYAEKNSVDNKLAVSLLWIAVLNRDCGDDFISQRVKLVEDVNVVLDDSGNTIVHLCSMHRVNAFRKNIITFLVSLGAKLDTQNGLGNTPLHIAASHITPRKFDLTHTGMIKDYAANVETLIRLEAPINAKNKKGKTALFLAAQFGYEKEFDILIKYGAEVHVEDHRQYFPLIRALHEIVDAVPQTKMDKIIEDRSMRYKLNGSKESYIHICSELIKKYDKTHADSSFILNHVAFHGTKEMVFQLLSKGVDVNVIRNAKTVLDLVADRKPDESRDMIAHMLINKGAIVREINETDSKELKSIKGKTIKFIEELSIKSKAGPVQVLEFREL